MSRFLARALALAALPAPGTRETQREAASETAPRAVASHAPAWPDGADYWLTCDAVALAGILNMGGTARFCPNGGLDLWDAAGLYRGFSPDLVRRLRAAGLLLNMPALGALF